MSLKRHASWVAGGILIVALAFGAGWLARDRAGPRILVGSGSVGDAVATLFVDGDAYGFRSSVNWTDSHGTFHDGGWPDCLPRLHDVTGIRFAGEVQWIAGVGTDEIVWVDCSTP